MEGEPPSASDGEGSRACRRGNTHPRAAHVTAFPPLPVLTGEGWGEGQLHTVTLVAAPPPSPRRASKAAWRANSRVEIKRTRNGRRNCKAIRGAGAPGANADGGFHQSR